VEDEVGDEDYVAMDEAKDDAKNKKIQRTGGNMTKKDPYICWSTIFQRPRIAINHDSICGAEQKGKSYWRKVIQDFHEHQKLSPFKIHCDHREQSIQKTWGFNDEETNKFRSV
jgi:hypothetical protein